MPDTPTLPRSVIKRLLTPPLVVLAVALVLFEEHLWLWLVRLGEWAGGKPLIRVVEARIAALPPAAALAMLLLPAGLILPIKLVAVWLMARGDVLTGLAVLVAAKVGGTALVARIYMLCEPALATIPWFVRLRARLLRAKDWAHRRLESWPAWRLARRRIHRLVLRVRLWSGRRGPLAARWRGIRRRMAPRRA